MDKVAAVYANALVDLAQSKNALDTVHADVDSLQVGLLNLQSLGLYRLRLLHTSS